MTTKDVLVAIAAGLFGLIVGVEIGIRTTAARYRRRLGGYVGGFVVTRRDDDE